MKVKSRMESRIEVYEKGQKELRQQAEKEAGLRCKSQKQSLVQERLNKMGVAAGTLWTERRCLQSLNLEQKIIGSKNGGLPNTLPIKQVT